MVATHTAADELTWRVAQALPSEGRRELLAGLYGYRREAPSALFGVSDTGLCLVAQGAKDIWLAGERYRYDAAHYLLVSSELPITTQITEASPARPYLSLRLKLPAELISAVMAETGYGARGAASVRALAVSPLAAGLLDAVLRLVRLAESPEDAPYLAPLIKREIIFRLLKGEQGARLRQLVGDPRIMRAIAYIREHFDAPLHVDALAETLAMSPSSLYQHFKAVTAMSPLQFQKRLRLQEARRLMVAEQLDAASAAYRVGYGDASQFSREYKRLFGTPPARDAERLRAAGTPILT
jgi:AraC-like DNA-binding protein